MSMLAYQVTQAIKVAYDFLNLGHLSTLPITNTAWKVSKYGAISGPYFPVLGWNTEIYEVNLRIQSEYRKIRTRNNFVFGHFLRTENELSILSRNIANLNNLKLDWQRDHLRISLTFYANLSEIFPCIYPWKFKFSGIFKRRGEVEYGRFRVKLTCVNPLTFQEKLWNNHYKHFQTWLLNKNFA